MDTVAWAWVEIASAQVEEVGYPKEGEMAAVPSKEEKEEGWARSLKTPSKMTVLHLLKY